MNGSFALYENPRAATIKNGDGPSERLTVLGIWTDGRIIRYLVVGKGKKEGAGARFVRSMDVDIYVGDGR